MARHPDDLSELYRLLNAARRHCEVLACGAGQSHLGAKLGRIFARLAIAKTELAGDLARALDDGLAAPVPASDTVARCRRTDRLYRRWLPSPVSGKPPANACDVAALDAAEDRLLHRCEQVLSSQASPALRLSLKRYVPQIEACHAELRRLYPGPPTRSPRVRVIGPWLSGLKPQGFETPGPGNGSF